MKKITVVPVLANELQVVAQLRCHPDDGDTDEFYNLVVARALRFAFNGKVLLKSGDDDEDDDAPEQADIEDGDE